MDDNTPYDPFDQIEERLSNPPLDWDPRGAMKDDERTYRERRVVGTVEERETLAGMKDKPYERLVVKLRNSTTRVSVRCWATVLSGKVARKDPRPGDLFGVEYQGSKPNSDPSLADIELFEITVVKAIPSTLNAETTDPDPGEETHVMADVGLPLGPGGGG